MLFESNLLTTALVGLCATAFVLYRHWRKDAGAGLLLTYLISFGVIHWLAPLLYLLPWYGNARIDPTTQGLRLSAIAMLAFTVINRPGILVA